MLGIDLETAQHVLKRTLKAVESTKFVTEDGRPVAMTLSIGLAMATANDVEATSLIDRASGTPSLQRIAVATSCVSVRVSGLQIKMHSLANLY